MNGREDPVSIATSASPVVDLAVDVFLDTIVVITSNGSVTSLSFDGQNMESIVPVSSEIVVAGGAVFEDYVYLTYPSLNTVERFNKFPQREGELTAQLCICEWVYSTYPNTSMGR